MPLSIAESGRFVLEFIYEWEKMEINRTPDTWEAQYKNYRKGGQVLPMGGTKRKELRNGRLLTMKF